jgi:hypothetical protein
MEIVQSIDRPDVNGVLPKMYAICEQAKATIPALPYLSIVTNDNIMSSVWIRGSYQSREEWNYGIYENSPYFSFFLKPHKGQRYYTEGEEITVELASVSYKVGRKFRKYTGTPEKCLQKIAAWIREQQ